jgi:hypothetical protein
MNYEEIHDPLPYKIPSLRVLGGRVIVKLMLNGQNLAENCSDGQKIIIIGESVLMYLKKESKKLYKRGKKSFKKQSAQLVVKFPVDCLACAFVSNREQFLKTLDISLSRRKQDMEEQDQMSSIMELLLHRARQREEGLCQSEQHLTTSPPRPVIRSSYSIQDRIEKQYKDMGLVLDSRVDMWILPKHSLLLDQFTVDHPCTWKTVWKDLVLYGEIDLRDYDTSEERKFCPRVVYIEVSEEEYKKAEEFREQEKNKREEQKRKQRQLKEQKKAKNTIHQHKK